MPQIGYANHIHALSKHLSKFAIGLYGYLVPSNLTTNSLKLDGLIFCGICNIFGGLTRKYPIVIGDWLDVNVLVIGCGWVGDIPT